MPINCIVEIHDNQSGDKRYSVDTLEKLISISSEYGKSQLVEQSRTGNVFTYKYKDTTGYSSLFVGERTVTFTLDKVKQQLVDFRMSYNAGYSYSSCFGNYKSGNQSFFIELNSCNYDVFKDSLLIIQMNNQSFLNAIDSIWYNEGFSMYRLPVGVGYSESYDYLSLSADTQEYRFKMVFELSDKLNNGTETTKTPKNIGIQLDHSGNVLCSFSPSPVSRKLLVFDVMGRNQKEFTINPGVVSFLVPNSSLSKGCHFIKLGNEKSIVKYVK